MTSLICSVKNGSTLASMFSKFGTNVLLLVPTDLKNGSDVVNKPMATFKKEEFQGIVAQLNFDPSKGDIDSTAQTIVQTGTVTGTISGVLADPNTEYWILFVLGGMKAGEFQAAVQQMAAPVQTPAALMNLMSTDRLSTPVARRNRRRSRSRRRSNRRWN